MHEVIFEVGLALALMAGAALLSARLRLSVVPFLILIGMAVGPHAPHLGIFDLRFIKSEPLIAFMGRLGVLFLLFYLGLEFSVGRLLKAGRAIAWGGALYMAINFPLGLALGYFLGWPLRETLVLAGIMTISSSAIVAKLIVELKRSANPETEMVLGIMMFQDVFVAVYLAIISGLVLGGAASVGGLLTSVAIALGFMLAFIALGRRLVPFLNRVLDVASDEIFQFVLFAALFMVAGLAESIHVAEAIGALLLGLVLAETDHRQRIEHNVMPFRDLFGALFFFHFGLSIDPLRLGGGVFISLVAVVLTLAGNFGSGLLIGHQTGLSVRASTYLGLTLTSRGEFSIVLANMALAGGLLAALQPVAALYVLSLAILGPVLTKEAKRVHARLFGQPAARKPTPQPPVP